MSFIEQLKDTFNNLGSNYGNAFEPEYEPEKPVETVEVKPTDEVTVISAKTEELRKISKRLSKIAKQLEKLAAEQE